MDLGVLKDLPAFVIAAFVTLTVARLYFKTQLQETAARVELAKLENERIARDARLADALALHQAQQTAAFAVLIGGQKQTAQTVVSTSRQVIASGKVSSTAIMEAISEVMRGMVKLTAGQTDQTTALNMITEAVRDLSEMFASTADSISEGKPDDLKD